MVIADHFNQEDFENLMSDARFFAQRVQDLNFVDDVEKRYRILGMQAALTEKQAANLKEIGGWA
jgi:hypothetical protein